MTDTFLGVDAGFSARVRSTGVCVIQPGSSDPVRCAHVKTQHTADAIRELLAGAVPVAASIDGPLVPSLLKTGLPFTTVNRYRRCEQMLSGGIFQKRCKPGPTNSPRGLALHKQATLVANHLLSLFPSVAISESFPNAFMGVMLPDEVYSGAIRRGVKSDVFWTWLVHESNLMQKLLKHQLGNHSAPIFSKAQGLANHDERAAFICALTALGAHLKKAFVVDGGADGGIVLPPLMFVQPWAKNGLALVPAPAEAERVKS